MDSTRFDAAIRLFNGGMTRRTSLRVLGAGAAALIAGSALSGEKAEARRTRRRQKRDRTPNVCAGLNWCLDRSQTCGPEGAYGKCLVDARGKHICAEILFQVPSCTECEEPNCLNCRCVPAEGGVDRCNNGANGYGFICVRKV
jgi:hypothetical protein